MAPVAIFLCIWLLMLTCCRTNDKAERFPDFFTCGTDFSERELTHNLNYQSVASIETDVAIIARAEVTRDRRVRTLTNQERHIGGRNMMRFLRFLLCVTMMPTYAEIRCD